MKFRIEKASEVRLDCKPEYIHFETLVELMFFVSKKGKVIIYPDNKIVIYDDYME